MILERYPYIIYGGVHVLIIYLLLLFSGPEASVAELTDLICAAQVAREEDCYLLEDDLKV